MIDSEDRIIKVVELNAQPARVWRALTDHEEFGAWFRVKLDQPFSEGELSTGRMTFPGYENLPWRAQVERMEEEQLFSFRWHDYDDDSKVPIEEQPTMLVEFQLEQTPDGTRLTITESGFSALSNPRRLEVLRENTKGWDIQADNIAAHIAS